MQTFDILDENGKGVGFDFDIVASSHAGPEGGGVALVLLKVPPYAALPKGAPEFDQAIRIAGTDPERWQATDGQLLAALWAALGRLDIPQRTLDHLRDELRASTIFAAEAVDGRLCQEFDSQAGQ